MQLSRIVTHTILISMIPLFLSSCSGQSKTKLENSRQGQETIGKIAKELAPNTHLIYQDRQQQYWFSNDTALYQYDGNTLLRFTPKDGLVSSSILGVQEDKLGQLYFDTPDGVSKFDGKQFETLKVAAGPAHENRWSLGEEDLWFRMGWDNKGPYRFDGEYLYPLVFPKSKIEASFYAKYPNVSYNPYGIFSMYKDRRGRLWFGTSDLGIYQFDGQQIRWMHEAHLGTTTEGGAFGIRSIAEDQAGHFWICNSNYKYKILPDSIAEPQALKQLNYKREAAFVHKHEEVLYFMSMLLDDQGNLWMSNLDGMWKNDGQSLQAFFVQDGKNKITPSSVYQDQQGKLWFGTQSDGIYKYDGAVFEKFVGN